MKRVRKPAALLLALVMALTSPRELPVQRVTAMKSPLPEMTGRCRSSTGEITT